MPEIHGLLCTLGNFCLILFFFVYLSENLLIDPKVRKKEGVSLFSRELFLNGWTKMVSKTILQILGSIKVGQVSQNKFILCL